MSTEESKEPEAPKPAPEAPKPAPAKTPSGEGAPGWVVPLYVGGLVVFYLGERVFSTFESGHTFVSGLGLAAVLAATVARFVPTWQAGGERGRIERLLGLLSVVGGVGLVFYLGTTDFGLAKLGLLTAADDKRESAESLLTIAWVVLVCLSVVPMLFAEAALYPMRNAERLESRRVRAAATAGATLALAAVYGALFVYSASGSDMKADFSYFKTSEPSDSTRKLIEGLNEPIRVVAFFPEVSPVRYEVENYLKKLQAGAKNLKVDIQDRYLAPKLAKEMKIVQDGVIVIQKGEAKRMVTVGTEMNDARKNLKTLDRDFQERVYKLLRERRNIYLSVGHGEINDEERGSDQQSGRSASILKQLLGKQNYNTKNLGLSQGLATDVPDDADILVILGPTQPFAPEEISAISRYAKRGGKLLVALDPDAVSAQPFEAADAERAEAAQAAGGVVPASAKTAPPAPSAAGSAAPPGAAAPAPGSAAETSLEGLAKAVGVQFSPVILANDKQFARRRYNDSDRTLLVTNRFSSHASVSTLSRNSSRAAILVAGAGTVSKAAGSTAKVDIALRAVSSTFQDTNRNYVPDEGEKKDTFGLAAAVTQPAEGGGLAAAPKKDEPKKDDKDAKKDIPAVAPPNEMRAFVLSDADVFTDLVMSNFMANQLLLVDALRWLGGEESFAGAVNNEEDVKIEHTQQGDLVWFYSSIIGAPALVLGLGLAYSRNSRRPRGGKK